MSLASGPRGGRLASLKNPGRSPLTSTSEHTPTSGGGGRGKEQPKCCATPNIQNVDESRVCMSCGTVFSEIDIDMRVEFSENAAGAATVEGAAVRDGQRHANTLGKNARLAGGGMSSREQSEWTAQQEIRKLSGALHLQERIEEQAFQIWKLAANVQFTAGRKVRMVVAVCLYCACRRQKGNTTLLIDLAEKIQTNVFQLGDVYKDLLKALCMEEAGAKNGMAPVLDVEPLIMKFARKLEFGSETSKVAFDALQILKCMRRDWMIEGRQPAGLCGACLIIAARMNNFRRSVREVVYIVKVADTTIAERIEEFKRTVSGNLTVQQFREFSTRMKSDALPPAIYKRLEKEEKLRRMREEAAEDGNEDRPSKRPRIENAPSDERPSEVGPTDEANDHAAITTPTDATSETRRDADGFVIPNPPAPPPAIPIDPSLIAAANIAHGDLAADDAEAIGLGDAATGPAATTTKKKRKYTKAPKPVITEADLMVEEELEHEMEELLDGPELHPHLESAEFQARSRLRAEALADELRGESRVRAGAEIEADEFADDPEIANCLLSPAEVAIKERIWVTHNEDWLRTQQAKLLKKTLEEANGDGEAAAAARRRRKRRQKKREYSRMGDGSLLDADGAPVVTNAAEASRAMLAKRAKGFSRHINYDALTAIYGANNKKEGTSASASASGSARGSPAPSFISGAGGARGSGPLFSRATSRAPSEAVSEILSERGGTPGAARPDVQSASFRLGSLRRRGSSVAAPLTPPASQQQQQTMGGLGRLASLKRPDGFGMGGGLGTPPLTQASQASRAGVGEAEEEGTAAAAAPPAGGEEEEVEEIVEEDEEEDDWRAQLRGDADEEEDEEDEVVEEEEEYYEEVE